MSITITRAHLTKIFTIELSYSRPGAKIKGEELEAIAHEDLINAFKKLTKHFAFITFRLNSNDFDPSKLDLFHVSSYVRCGPDNCGIIISGTEELPNKKKMGINTPFTRWDDYDPTTGYSLIEELSTDVANLEKELVLYYEGKQAPKLQLELEIPEADKDAMNRIKEDEDATNEMEQSESEPNTKKKKKRSSKKKAAEE